MTDRKKIKKGNNKGRKEGWEKVNKSKKVNHKGGKNKPIKKNERK